MNRTRFNLLLLSFAASAAVLVAQTNTFPASGAVGIGTTSPASKLDIAENGQHLTFLINKKLVGVWPAADEATTMTLQSSGYSAGNLAFATGNSEWMRLTQTGNVGIGTTGPTERLQVAGSISASGGNLHTNRGRLSFSNTAGDVNHTIYNNYTNIDGEGAWDGMKMNVYAGLDVRVGNAAGATPSSALRIGGNGNVGIGTTNPGAYKLAVVGKIRAQEIVVDTGWSDYVFASDYQLPALSAVEAHIKAEKHLPGIPSAQEVAEHGISVGEMHAKLLAKIEELTLHQIEQEKAIVRLYQINAKLQSRIDELTR